MNYAKSLLFTIFISLAFILSANAAIFQLPERFKITNSPFLDKITSIQDLECKVFLSKQNKIIPVEETIFILNVQELI